MKIGFAQINPTVGDLQGNFEKIVKAYDQLADARADIVIAPELAVPGYPPQDLLFKSRFVPENLEVLDRLQKRLSKPALLVGFVDRNEGRGKRDGPAARMRHTAHSNVRHQPSSDNVAARRALLAGSRTSGRRMAGAANTTATSSTRPCARSSHGMTEGRT